LSAFIKISEQLGYDFRLLKEVQRINAEQMDRFIKKIQETLWVLKDKKIGVLGLAFKQNTDDVRLSPAIDLCQRLLKEGAILRVHDPKAMDNARKLFPTLTYAETAMDAVRDAHVVLHLTEWEEFRTMDPDVVAAAVAERRIVDGRNALDPVRWRAAGWTYRALGRP